MNPVRHSKSRRSLVSQRASAGWRLMPSALLAALLVATTPVHAGVGNWTSTSTTSAPSGRTAPTAVWTGSKMIVWGGWVGGQPTDTGGVYDPATDQWTATSTTNAPSARANHTAVWTGSKMIVWGGWDLDTYLNTGGIYDLGTNTWTATSMTGAPSARELHTAVWTGSEMIIWGGFDGGPPDTNPGGMGNAYEPGTDTWTAVNTSNAPSPRWSHTAVWTGSKMIVWGGTGGPGQDAGGIYDTATDTWTATSITNAPTARIDHTAVWTGSKMIVWGGYDVYAEYNDGAIYDPVTDSWSPTATNGAPSSRSALSAVWANSKMVIWGGWHGYSTTNTGGVYEPTTDTWSATGTTDAPSSRGSAAAVWTGSEMIIWGGFGSTGTTLGANGDLDAGGVFDLAGADPGDFDADGHTDILWHNQSTGQLYAWLMNGTTQSSGLFVTPPTVNPVWQVRGIGDLDGDKRSDLLWHNQSTGQLYAWFMNGTSQSSGTFLTPSPVNLVWQVQGLADFNGDGKADILWRNKSTGQLYVWFMNGITESSGTFLTPAAVADPAWQIRGLADIDYDGKVDIVWHNRTTGQLYVWYMDGGAQSWGSFLNPASVPQWRISQVADFDGDGLPDILWRNQSSGALYVWVMDHYWMTSGRFLAPSPVSNLNWQVVPR
jgi:N-acetylneuraminic acid mutarotase